MDPEPTKRSKPNDTTKPTTKTFEAVMLVRDRNAWSVRTLTLAGDKVVTVSDEGPNPLPVVLALLAQRFRKQAHSE